MNGGGIYIENSVVNIQSTEISGNHCLNPSLSPTGHGGGICVFSGVDIDISNSVINGNSA